MSVSESRVENAAVRARGLARAINTSRSDQPPTLRVDEVRKRVQPLNLATARFIHSVSAGAAESLVIGPCDSIRAVAVKSRPALDADSWTRVLLISPTLAFSVQLVMFVPGHRRQLPPPLAGSSWLPPIIWLPPKLVALPGRRGCSGDLAVRAPVCVRGLCDAADDAVPDVPPACAGYEEILWMMVFRA